MSYGNPYTLFNKNNGNWQTQLELVRQRILNGVDPRTGVILDDYATLYSGIF
jgi:hypothetical protein